MQQLNIKNLFRNHRNKLGWLILAGVVFYGLFIFRFNTMMPLYAPVEIATQEASASLTAIWQNPVYAPYKLLVWAPYKFVTESVLITRLVASLFGAITLWIFFLILKQRYSLRQAVFGTAIFATSSAFLHASRLGAPYILQTAMLLPFVLPLLWYHPKVPRNLIPYVMIALFAICLYIPGFIWFVLAGSIVYRKHLINVAKAMSNKHQIIAGLLALIMVSPLIWSAVRDVSVIKELLGLSSQLPSISQYFVNVWDNLRSLLWQSTQGADLSLIGAPMLSVVDIVLAIFGFYHLWHKDSRLVSTYYITGILVLTLLLSGLGGSIKLVMLAPFVYLFVAAGIYYLLSQWLKIFPRNPIAKNVAVAMIIVLVGASCVFHARSYFVAWPNNSYTKALFTKNQPAPRN